MIDQLQDIFPALTGFFLGLIVLVYFVFKKNSLGIRIASISCILLMFIFEIISVNFNFNFNDINSFFEKTKNIFDFPLVTVLVTTASIFIGNTLIRSVTDRKEKREFAILFINAIKFQINVLERIFYQIDLPKLRTEDSIVTEGREYIEIYKSNLIEEKSYDVAFNKIGIFNENDIDLVFRYHKQLKESLLYVNIFCCTMGGDTEIYDEYQGKINFKNITNTEERNLIKSFIDIKIFIPITIILGYLCIYQLSLNYSPQNLDKDRENFLESAKSTYNSLSAVFSDGRIFPNYYFNNGTFHILNRITSDTLIETLNYIRESYRKIDKAKDTNKREPIYLTRILINRGIRLMATPKNGNWEGWENWIDIISSGEDFISFKLLTPSTTKKMLKRYIKEKFKELEESSEIRFLFFSSKCKVPILEKDFDGLEEYVEENIDEFIEKCKYESYIISPWGEEIKEPS
ncbi:MAG: hypothetical protein F6K23_13605 [Okeania sp. SIO2C9]|uniref:hypothetical protein n=1 Tax=Okeania sp. SIO2C9 TaxID=2607791 RepID=UPI0013C297D8|nr:hypothetical protein [Okeania sp. SIO2C9]NEQ73986.1 hypothetical protein [Okeania sp. SIO2C9]